MAWYILAALSAVLAGGIAGFRVHPTVSVMIAAISAVVMNHLLLLASQPYPSAAIHLSWAIAWGVLFSLGMVSGKKISSMDARPRVKSI